MISLDAHTLRLLQILRYISTCGSLYQAVKLIGCSYSYAWALVRRFESAYNTTFLIRARQRGSTLTAEGRRCLEILSEIESYIANQNIQFSKYCERLDKLYADKDQLTLFNLEDL